MLLIRPADNRAANLNDELQIMLYANGNLPGTFADLSGIVARVFSNE